MRKDYCDICGTETDGMSYSNLWKHGNAEYTLCFKCSDKLTKFFDGLRRSKGTLEWQERKGK